MTIIYLTLAWTTGILLGKQVVDVSSTTFWAVAIVAGAGAIWRRKAYSHRLVLSCLAVGMLGILRMTAATSPPGPDALANYNGAGWRTFEGTVIAEPDVRDQHINLRVAIDLLHQHEDTAPTHGVALVQAPRYGGYAYGDRVVIAGTPLVPPEFDDFSYRDYLARQNIFTYIPSARVEIISSGHGSPMMHVLLRIKQRSQAAIARSLPEPAASLLTGILLGIETGISPDVREAFNATGASHVIAISGFNMTLIAGLLSRFLGLLWPKRRGMTAGASIVAILVYGIFVGANPAVMRAALMSMLLIIAPLANRKTYVPASLAFAALVLSIQDPFVFWDVGFQLSFAAVIGLALFVSPIENGFRQILTPLFSSDRIEQIIRLMSEPLIVTLAAQITTLPLIVYYFGRLSLSSFVVNFLILPVQTPLLLLGGSATILALIVPALAQPFYWAAWLFLTWTIEVVRFFARLPGASIAVTVDKGIIVVYYLAIIAGMILQGAKPRAFGQIKSFLTNRRARLLLVGTGILAAAILWLAVSMLPDGQLHVTFLDTGHSNGVLIQTPDGAYVLIDGGKYPTRLLTALGDHMPFWDRHLDMLILTQPKNAQVAAIPAVLDRYSVGQVLTNGQVSDAENVVALYERLAAHNIPVQPVSAGYLIECSDGVTLEVLFPDTSSTSDPEPNNSGLVLRLTYGEASFLLTPDMSETAEARLLSTQQWLHGTVLQLPSHGSAQVSSARFLQAAAPQIAVVQVDTGNRFGHPAEDVINRLDTTPLYRTDTHGEISIRTDGVSLWITTDRTS